MAPLLRVLSGLAVPTALLLLGCERAAECPSPEPAESSVASAPASRPSSDGPSKPGAEVGPVPKDPEPPPGYVSMEVVGVAGTELSNVVLLGSSDDKVIPIFVGGTEALSIHLRFNSREYQRPLTHDLLDSVMSTLGSEIIKSQVDKLENDIFYGSVFIERDGKLVKIDSRPSDAIALALGSGAPIFVAEDVLEIAAVSRSDALSPQRAPGDPLAL